MSKAVDLVADTAATAGVPPRLPAIHSLLADAGRAHGEDDMAAIIEAACT